MTTGAIVHPLNLLGRELRESLGRRRTWGEIELFSTREDEIGTVTEVGGAAALVLPFEAERLRDVSFAFFCGKIAETRPLLAGLPAGTTPILLCLDATPEDGLPVLVGVNSSAALPGAPLLSPHPIASLLALTLAPLRRFGIEEVVATVIQPASFFDEAGLGELFDQTRSIVALSSRGASPLFGAQLAFNLLPTQPPAEPIAAQLGLLLADLPAPRLQILQGAVFHAVSASLFVRLRERTTAGALRKALAGHPFLEAAAKPRTFGPIDAAGGDRVLFGAPRQDGKDGFWLWVAVDNLIRGGALNALELAESLG